MVTLSFRDGLSLSALASVLAAVDLFDLRAGCLLTPGIELWLDFFAAEVPARQKLSQRIRAHERFVRETGSRARLDSRSVLVARNPHC